MMLGKFARSFVRPTVTRSSRSVIRFSTSLETVTDDLKRMLIQLISPTERGVKDTNRAQIFQVIDDLSKSSVSFATEDMLGEWELLYSDDDVTRASPFFWAFRKALSGIEDPLRIVGPKLLSESIFKITDSIPLKSIGTASQIFEEDDTKERGSLRSRIQVKVNPGNFQSVMATTSKWRRTDEPDLIEIEVFNHFLLMKILHDGFVVHSLSFLLDAVCFVYSSFISMLPNFHTLYPLISQPLSRPAGCVVLSCLVFW